MTSVEHATDGEWPVACVVRRPGSTVTAQEIVTLVAGNYVQVVIRAIHSRQCPTVDRSSTKV